MNRRAIFLDRDGVLNRAVIKDGKPYPPANVEEVEILPGVMEGLKLLKEAGYLLLVVSNQPDVARGATSKATVEAINNYLADYLPIDRFSMCYHDSVDNCSCRKPRPGLLLAGAEEFGIDLESSYMVGDRWRDVEAGRSAKCSTIFIDYGYNEKQPHNFDYKCSSFSEVTEIILKGNEYEKN